VRLLPRPRGRALAVVGLTAFVLAAMTIPVSALIARLTTLPLGRGEATITWTGRSGDNPTVNAIKGHVGRFDVAASDHLPRLDQGSSGSIPTSIPSDIPFGQVKGKIDGASFTLEITLSLAGLTQSTKSVSLGTVTGSLRNAPIHVRLLGNPQSQSFEFAGTIGSDHVTGTIAGVTHHGSTSEAHASYDVTR
jgi:hypothetical protein